MTADGIPGRCNVGYTGQEKRRGELLKIGWVIPTVGIFGAVREMLEVSNALIRIGHSVTVYHPGGKAQQWLPSGVAYGDLAQAVTEPLDVMIGIVDWQPELYEVVTSCRAGVKAICLMGFSGSAEMAAGLRKEKPPADKAERVLVDAMDRGLVILADSQWQVDWLYANTGYAAGPPFGGVNLAQFHQAAMKRPRSRLRVLASGDPRERKGSDTVGEALQIAGARMGRRMETDAYWGKGFTQTELAEFLQDGDLFVDGHRRAGWCNPVAEAMACGTAVVCTNIGATQDFAIHEETALVVPVNDVEAMAQAVERILTDNDLRRRLVRNGLEQIKKFDYNRVAAVLEGYLTERVAKAAANG